MITFLTWVTVIYAVVLVVVLAVSLITILYFLWSIGTSLGKISAGLARVRDQTAPLAGHIDAINGALGTVAQRLDATLDDLAHVNGALADLVGESQPATKKVA